MEDVVVCPQKEVSRRWREKLKVDTDCGNRYRIVERAL